MKIEIDTFEDSLNLALSLHYNIAATLRGEPAEPQRGLLEQALIEAGAAATRLLEVHLLTVRAMAYNDSEAAA